MRSALYNSDMAGVTSGEGIGIPLGVAEFFPALSGVRVARFLAFCAVFCRSLIVPLSFSFGSFIVLHSSIYAPPP